MFSPNESIIITSGRRHRLGGGNSSDEDGDNDPKDNKRDEYNANNSYFWPRHRTQSRSIVADANTITNKINLDPRYSTTTKPSEVRKERSKTLPSLQRSSTYPSQSKLGLNKSEDSSSPVKQQEEQEHEQDGNDRDRTDTRPVISKDKINSNTYEDYPVIYTSTTSETLDSSTKNTLKISPRLGILKTIHKFKKIEEADIIENESKDGSRSTTLDFNRIPNIQSTLKRLHYSSSDLSSYKENALNESNRYERHSYDATNSSNVDLRQHLSFNDYNVEPRMSDLYAHDVEKLHDADNFASEKHFPDPSLPVTSDLEDDMVSTFKSTNDHLSIEDYASDDLSIEDDTSEISDHESQQRLSEKNTFERKRGQHCSYRRSRAAFIAQRHGTKQQLAKNTRDYYSNESDRMMSGELPQQEYTWCNILLCIFFCCSFTPSKHKPSWNRVSAFVVRKAPCFWCCGERLETSATDRVILTRLNFLCAFFALMQVAVGLFLAYVTLSPTVADRSVEGNRYDPKYYREALTPNLWTLSGSIYLTALLGLAIFFITVFSRTWIREVNITGAIRYLWALYWLLPFEIFLVISLIDYHKVTGVWVKHWWSSASMAWFRKVFCDAEEDGLEKCAIPTSENDWNNTAWCKENFFNSTDCWGIRERATGRMIRSSYAFFYSNAVLGLIVIILLVLALSMLEGIITAPIVQKSKESNVPLWLTFPAIGCLAVGSVLQHSPSSVFKDTEQYYIYWIGKCYLTSAGSFGFSALLGWFISAKTVFNNRDKTRKLFAIYIFIGMLILTIIAVAAILVTSVMYSSNLVKPEKFSSSDRGDLACFVDSAESCSACNNNTTASSDTKCPEWSTEDVLKVMRTQLKQSASIASIFLIYALGALRFGFVLRYHVARYEIDYA